MKITRILFLGIVLAVLNVAYLAAQLPDTVFVGSTTAKPGETLNLTVGIDFNTTNAGGVIAVLQFDPTLAEGLDTVAGAWYTWDANFGQKLIDGDPGGLVAGAIDAQVGFDKDAGTVTVSIFGVNVGALANPLVAVINADKKGDLVHFAFQVASTVPEDSYAINAAAEDALVILPWPITADLFTEYPILSAQPIMIATIPDYNALQLGGTSLDALIGDTLVVPVRVENQDSIGSGSFTLTYPSSMLTYFDMEPGFRSGGMTGTSTVTTVDATTRRLNVSFTGGIIPPGGLGDVVRVYFGVSAMNSGAGQVTLGDVVLRDPAGVVLAASTQQPSPSSAAVNFFFGDSLIVDLQAGDYSAINPSQRTVSLPIRLVNRTGVSVIRFFVNPDPLKPAGILAVSEVNLTDRTTGWIVSANPANGQVLTYAPTLGDVVAPGNGNVFMLTLSILRPLLPSELPLDVDMLLTGIEIIDAAGNTMGIQKVNGTASLDERVPNEGEGVNPGSSLPKVFALAQNAPNPFNPSTTINYQIPEDAGAGVRFNLNVYDIRGRLVKNLADGIKGPGSYSAYWDGTNNNGQPVASGVYFYRFTSDKFNSTRKMILLK